MTAIYQPSTGSTVTVNDGDEFFIGRNTEVVTTSGYAFTQSTPISLAGIFNLGTVAALTSDAINVDMQSGQIYNAGEILTGSSFGRAITVIPDYISGVLSITNVQTGLINGTITIGENDLSGSGPVSGAVRIENHGQITAPTSSSVATTRYGIDLDGDFEGQVYNYGSIYGSEGIFFSASSEQAGNNFYLYNTGSIVGSRYDGVDTYTEGTNSSTIINSGLIHSLTDNAIEVDGNARIVNEAAGLIDGAVFTRGSSSTGQLINRGRIVGDVDIGNGNNIIVNSGIIEGNVASGTGIDIYDGMPGGIVTGTINLFSGDDVYYIAQDDAIIHDSSGNDTVYARSDLLNVTGIEEIRLLGSGDYTVEGGDTAETINGNIGNNLISGNAGADTINGGAGDDVLNGGDNNDSIQGAVGSDEINGDAGNDTLRGGAGDDTVNGGADNDSVIGDDGNDVLNGNFGNDTLIGALGDDALDGGGNDDFIYGQSGNDYANGGAGADKLFGGIGDDTLIGGADNDTVVGDAGNDVIYGGLGVDYLMGKSGDDTFVYESITEIDNGASDRVADFQTGDLIDVAAIGDETAFTFLGTGAFTGSGAAEIRYFVNASGTAIVYFDTDGNGGSDGELVMANTSMLTADDFIL